MPASHAWLFQATPRALDLAAELRAGEALSWSVARHGADLRAGDRVYYWQAGRDAGIYGLGRVGTVSARNSDGRRDVTTAHERALFAPVTRAELRRDPELRDLAVLRQPRGTVFPLTPAEDLALARRIGDSALSLALPAGRRAAGKARLSDTTDADLPALVENAQAHGDEVLVALVAGAEVAEMARVYSARRRRDGDLELRLVALPGYAAPELPPDLAARIAEGQAVRLPGLLPASPASAVVAPAERRVAELPPAYAATSPRALSPQEVRGDLELPPALVASLIAALDAGRHVVLMGAPGTGKTTLALNLARVAASAGRCDGPLLTTATADWTTFDTVGGLVPGPDGALRFAEGVVLRALRENRWLVLDELNRADIDKAFGPLLTVLSGGAVDLPAITVDGRPVRVAPASERRASGVSDDGATYHVGADWRLLATMNTLDRAALFSFSLAFARRFAFMLVPPPDPATLLALVRRRAALDAPSAAVLERLLRVTPRPLGPAIMLDAAGYIAARADPAAPVEALCAFVLPQLEGLDPAAIATFARDMAPVLGPQGEAALLDYIRALFGEA